MTRWPPYLRMFCTWWAWNWASEMIWARCLTAQFRESTLRVQQSQTYTGRKSNSPALLNRLLKPCNRFYHRSTVKDEASEIALAQQNLIMARWSIMWRSILLSCFGKTLFPYHRYIRVLDLRDLANLIEDDKFVSKISALVYVAKISGSKFAHLA